MQISVPVFAGESEEGSMGKRRKQKATVNRNYKDTLFFFVFGREENKRYLLDLYNALRESEEPPIVDVNELELNTIENVIYLGRKNDVSFLIDAEMNLYEHQSTYNPNMPLRGVIYWSALMEKWLEKHGRERLYRSALLRIPTPKHIVFYNGVEERPAIEEMRLSDAFMKPTDGYEWKVVVYNINAGYNDNLLQECQPLQEYAEFNGNVQRNVASGMSLRDAVDAAFEAAEHGKCLGCFFRQHRAEVTNMILETFDEKEYIDMVRADAHESGLKEGHESGLKEGRESGLKEGHESGLKEGRESGLKEGRESGIKEGHASGVKEGLATGKVQTLLELVCDGLLEINMAAERAGISVEEFEKMLAER